jgi:hypothetical protein
MSYRNAPVSAPLVASIGGLVAVLGGIVAVIASGTMTPLVLGLLAGLGIVLLLVMGILIGNGRRNTTR